MGKKSSIGLLLFLSSIVAVVLYKTPSYFQLITAVSYTIFLFFIAKKDAISLNQIGISKQTIRSGLTLGVGISAIVFILFYIAYLISPSLFNDPRYDQSLQALLFSLLVFLPIRTVLLEEVLFRGVIPNYFNGTSTLQSYLTPSLLFGCWHILPSLQFKTLVVPVIHFSVPLSLTVLGTILATSIAGAFFLWLKKTSHSLVAPMIVHYTINAIGMVLAYLYFR